MDPDPESSQTVPAADDVNGQEMVSTTRAVVLPASLVNTLADRIPVTAENHTVLYKLAGELEQTSWGGMTDRDLAILVRDVELELYRRGWAPSRQWSRRDPA